MRVVIVLNQDGLDNSSPISGHKLSQGAHLQEPQALESERRMEPRKGLVAALSDTLSRWDLVGALVPYLKNESHSSRLGFTPDSPLGSKIAHSLTPWLGHCTIPVTSMG